MPAAAIDKELVQQRFCRSAGVYDDHAVVQRDMAERLCCALETVVGRRAEWNRVLELGCGTGVFTRLLLQRFRIKHWVGNDLACTFEPLAADVRATGATEASFLQGDMEACDLGRGWNLVCANASFQWLNDPVGFAGGLPVRMVPGGFLAYSTFGPENLAEVAAVTGRGLAYGALAEHVAAVERRCDILVADQYCHRMHFDTPRDVLRHLRATGVNAVSRMRWGQRELDRFAAAYRERFSQADGRVRLTYQPMLIVARIR